MKTLITILLLGLFISSQAQNISQSQVRQFNAVPAYRVFGRGTGVGTPSFIQLDSNHVPQLHSQSYYDLRYGLLSTQNGKLNSNFGTPGSVIFRGATALSQSNANFNYDSTNSALSVNGNLNRGVGYVSNNSSSGTAAEATFTVSNDAGRGVSLQIGSSNFSNDIIRNRGGIISTDGLALGTDYTSGRVTPINDIRFYHGAAATKPSVTFKPNRHALFGDSTDNANPNLITQTYGSSYVRDTLFANVLVANGTTVGSGGSYTDAQARAAIILTTAGSSGAATYSNSTGVLNIPQYTSSDTAFKVPFTGIDYYGKTVTYFGNSITFGVGATDNAHRWTTLLSTYLGAIEDNRGISGTVLEKRTPLNPFGSSPNMVDNLTTVPTKTTSKALLVIAYGINDVGWNATNYNPTNFALDYDSIMNYCINTKGWNRENILLIAPWYIDQSGYNSYSTNYGVTTPTVARHLQFIAATKATASKWGSLYIDPYVPMSHNGDSSLLSSDGLHPNNAGHAFIANLVGQYLSGTQSFAGYKQFNKIAVADSITASKNQNAPTAITVSNTTSGTSSQAQFIAVSSAGSTILGKFSGTKTALQNIASGDGFIYNSGSNLSVASSTGNINFAAGGSASSHLTIASTGAISTSNTVTAADNISASKDQNAATNVTASNQTSGTAAQAQMTASTASGVMIMGKFSAAKSSLLSIGAGDGYFYNGTAGNMTFVNAFSTGNINFAAGGSSTAHFTIGSTGKIIFPATNTAAGTTGAQTINKVSGSVNFAAGATTVVVTNSLVSATSYVQVQVYGSDATAKTATVTRAAGSFTITLNSAATAETAVGFIVYN